MLGPALRLCLVGTLLLGTTVAGKTVWEQRDGILSWVASIQQQLSSGSGAGTTQAASDVPMRPVSFLREHAVSRVSTVSAAPRTGQSASGVAPARRADSVAPARVADAARPAAARWTADLASRAAAPAVSRQKSVVSAPASPARASASAVPVPAAIGGGAFVWQGGSLTANWTNGGNWVGNTAPAPGASADIAFTSTPTTATASTVDTNYTINSLAFQTGTPAYTIGNDNTTLTINSGGITDASANQQNLQVTIALGAAQTWNVSDPNGLLYVQAGITGTGGITKTGPGTLGFGGSGTPNDFGTLTVSQGTVQLDKDGSINALSGNLVIGNATNPGAAGSVVVQLFNPDQTGTYAIGPSNTDVTIYADGLYNQTGVAGNDIRNLTMTGGEVRLGSSFFMVNSITTNASATSALISSTSFTDNLEAVNGSTITANVARGTATYDLDVQAGFSVNSEANGTLTTLVKNGTGVMRLAGTENDGFAVTLNTGTLALASDTALGNTAFPGDANSVPSTFTLAGGTVTADGGDRTIANPIALTGSATIGASLDGTPRAISFTGTTTLTGSQTLTVNNTAATTFAAVDLNGANTLTVAGTGNTTISGAITDESMGGSLIQNGTGTLTLTGASTYTGITYVNAGTLTFGNGGSLTNSADFRVQGGAALTIGDGGSMTIGNLSVGVSPDGVGSVMQTGGSVTTVNAGSNVEVGVYGTGSYALSDGTLSTDRLTVGLFADGTFTMSGGSVTAGLVEAGGDNAVVGTITQSAGMVTVGSSGVQLALVGTSSSGASSQGTYNLAGGTLNTPNVTGGPGTSTFRFNGGFLQASASDNPGAASNPSTFFSGVTHAYVGTVGAFIDTNGFNVTVASSLSPDPANGNSTDGGLTKEGSGTLTLTANNTYAGTTLVDYGALMVNNVAVKAGDSGTGSGPVYVGQGAWLGGTGTIGGSVTVGGYPPTTSQVNGVQPQVSAGAGTLTPGVAVGGVSTPGRLTINGNLTFASGTSVLEADIAGANAGTGYDQVRVGGNLTLAGMLTLTTGAGFTPTFGEKFYLFDLTGTGTVSGTFDGFAQGSLVTDSAGNEYVINYFDHDPADTSNLLLNDVSLMAVSGVPEPGTWALLGLGGAGLLGLTLCRRSMRA